MTGLPMSLLGLCYYSVFKASKPRPLGGAVPVTRPLGAKQNPLTRVGYRYLPNLLGGLPCRRLGFQLASGHQLEEYTTNPQGVKPFLEVFAVLHLPLNRPMPSPFGGACPVCGSLISHRPRSPRGRTRVSAREDYSAARWGVKRRSSIFLGPSSLSLPTRGGEPGVTTLTNLKDLTV